MMKTPFFLILGFLAAASLQASEKIPELLNQAPGQKFEILGPISATKKTVDEAQIELLHQGQKLEADAVILKNCQSGSIQREGLTWFKAQASCEGLAIRYPLPSSKIPSSKSLPSN